VDKRESLFKLKKSMFIQKIRAIETTEKNENEIS